MNDTDSTTENRFSLSALDEDFRNNPWPRLKAVREQGQGSLYDADLKTLMLFRAEHVAEVLRNRNLWMDPRKADPGTPNRMFLTSDDDREPSMLFLDDPEHKRLRSMVAADFTPKALERWRDKVRAIAEDLLDRLQGKAEWDLIDDYAGPLPTTVIAVMLGLDESDFSWFKTASDAIAAAFFNPMHSREEHESAAYWSERLEACFAAAIEQRRQNPGGEDLISSMVAAKGEGKDLNDQEIITQCNLLLIAGNITTTDLIGNSVHALLQHPEQWRLLCQQPELVGNAVEELLRFVPPVTNTARIASSAMEIAGCPVHSGEALALTLSSANRDPAHAEDPERLDIQRHKPQHYSFGGGAHFCLGAHLSRLEAQEALLALSARLPNLKLSEDGANKAERRALPSFSGFKHLPLLSN